MQNKTLIGISVLFFFSALVLVCLFGLKIEKRIRTIDTEIKMVQYSVDSIYTKIEINNLQSKLIIEQKEFIKTLEEDNQMLYNELYEANQKIMKRAIKNSLYSGATIQKAF